MLKLQFTDQRKPAIWLVDSRYAIGRDSSNDIVLEDEGISGFHAELRVEGDDRLFITDAGGAGGTLVNGQQIKARTQLRAGDIIRIASIELELVDPKQQIKDVDQSSETAIAPALNIPGHPNQNVSNPGWRLVARTGTLIGNEYEIPATGRVVIGRSQSCDIVLPSNHVSRQHAELVFRDGHLHVLDLGSSNGTFVNRKRITESRLETSDELRLDTLVFRVEGPPPRVPADAEKTVEIGRTASGPSQEAPPSAAPPTQAVQQSAESASAARESSPPGRTPVDIKVQPRSSASKGGLSGIMWLIIAFAVVLIIVALML